MEIDDGVGFASALRELTEAAKEWRASLGDSPETWLTGAALDLARAVDALETR